MRYYKKSYSVLIYFSGLGYLCYTYHSYAILLIETVYNGYAILYEELYCF